MNKLLSIGQASKALGVTIQTLRNWDKKGLLKPDDMTKGIFKYCRKEEGNN
ncbi:MerR family DNA-binding transcriptional regulator, partial [Campylobacter coli]